MSWSPLCAMARGKALGFTGPMFMGEGGKEKARGGGREALLGVAISCEAQEPKIGNPKSVCFFGV